MATVEVAHGRQVRYEGTVHRDGARLDVDESTAREWTRRGWAVRVEPKPKSRAKSSKRATSS